MPAFATLLPAFLDDLRQTLGADLVGAYLYGSAVAGGFEPAFSDLDLVVVTARSVDDLDFGVLAGLVDRLAVREPGWAERLDIAFVGRPTLASFRQGGALVSISHDLPLQRYDDADTWLQTWYLARAAATPLVGPPVGEVIPPIASGPSRRAS
ncbi:MAG TPA: nucleotidyltransferase domain-containing protein [Candidatus Limnocylindrales bacterium]|nr:nucleotidyltransferase domain-containing protein [Candidatus Limnocylindrales bacterium]